MPDNVFFASLAKPITRLLYALVAVAIVYACGLAHTQYIVYRSNLGETAQLRAQNQQMAQYIQQIQAQQKQQGVKAP